MTKARDLASAPVAPSTVSPTELGYLDGVTSAVQTQITSANSAASNALSVANTKATILKGTTGERPASPTDGQLYYDTTLNRLINYTTTGSKWVSAGDSPFNPSPIFDYLVIGGGGAGGDYHYGGGGGAGGYLTATNFTSPAGAFTITVGAGGSPNTGGYLNGNPGNNSVLASILAYGGGPGRSGNNAATGTYGSAGGGAGNATTGASPTSYTSLQGNNGGNGYDYPSHGAGGAGGGAGTAGSSGGYDTGGTGGNGLASSITGTSITRAGGGGGGTYEHSGSANSGGTGGGGRGSNNSVAATSGTVNTGSGGGGYSGVGPSSPAGNGGSGVVVIKYADTYDDITSIGAGLTWTKTLISGFKVYTFTAGTGLVTL